MQLTFEDIDSGKAGQELKEQFAHAGEDEVEATTDGRVRRTSGVSYKTLVLTFADGQQTALDIKATGDIFAVRLNGKPLPIRAQDSEPEAIAEIVKAMDAGRARFQAMQTRQKITLPSSIRTPVPKIEQALQQKHAELDKQIHDAQGKIADLKNELATLPALDSVDWSENVSDKWSPPDGFFDKPADDIASGLKSASDDYKQAADRLNFYINRAGDNLSGEDKSRLESAKSKLAELYGKTLDAVDEPDQKNTHDPDPNFFSPDTGDVQPAGVTIERSEDMTDMHMQEHGDNAPIPEKTATTAQEDAREAQEDQSQQYELSKHDPVNAEADRAIAVNEQQESDSKNPFNAPDVRLGEDDDPNDELRVQLYY